MRWEDRNISLHDMGNICSDDWKSRQHLKINEERYKEHVAKNSAAQLMDEILKELRNQKTQSQLSNSRRVAV
jgi:hypothetical protein